MPAHTILYAIDYLQVTYKTEYDTYIALHSQELNIILGKWQIEVLPFGVLEDFFHFSQLAESEDEETLDTESLLYIPGLQPGLRTDLEDWRSPKWAMFECWAR